MAKKKSMARKKSMTVVVRSSGSVFHPTPNENFSAAAWCEPGEVAVGFGFRGDSDPQHFGSLRHAVPVPDFPPGATRTGFSFTVRSGTQNGSFEGFVFCVKPGS